MPRMSRASRYGILGEHLDRVGAIGPMDADRAARAHTVRVQEDHDLPHGALALPVLDDAAGAHATDAGDVEQAVGLAIDHVEHAVPKAATSCLARCGPTPLIRPEPEVALDTFGRVRGRDADPVGLELLPVRAVVHPRAGGVDVFADGDLRRVADDRGGFASTPQRHAQDAEPALRVVIGDALDLSGHVLGALRVCLPAGAATGRLDWRRGLMRGPPLTGPSLTTWPGSERPLRAHG